MVSEQIATLAKEAIAGNAKEISSASFGLAALCAKLEDAQLAAGLKPAQVTAWFDANMKATLVAAFKKPNLVLLPTKSVSTQSLIAIV